MAKPQPTTADPATVRTIDRSRRHPIDAYLREHGFRIERRPRGGEPIWSLHRVEYLEREAIEMSDRLEEDARVIREGK